jgi:hypothetical protein
MSWRKAFHISIVILISTGLLLILTGIGLHSRIPPRGKSGLWELNPEPFGPPSLETLLSLSGLLMIAVGIALALLDLGFWMRRVKRKRPQ